MVTAIVNDVADYEVCRDIFDNLAKEANAVLDAESAENEISSGNSSSNYKSSSEPSFGENGKQKSANEI